MEAYHEMLHHTLEHGVMRPNRTGTDAITVFGYHFRHDLATGFPLITTKKTWFKGVKHELVWMIRGESNIAYLVENGVHIWDEWADEHGELGPVYGAQWRGWMAAKEDADGAYPDLVHHDQLQASLDMLKTDPGNRRNLVSAWNVGELDKMNLPPCHILFQFDVEPAVDELRYDAGMSQGEDAVVKGKPKLNCAVYMRSLDLFLGFPFDVASYAALTHIMAAKAGLRPGVLSMMLGNTHIYENHLDQVYELLDRFPKELPMLELSGSILNPAAELSWITANEIKVVGYDPHPAIKGKVSV